MVDVGNLHPAGRVEILGKRRGRPSSATVGAALTSVSAQVNVHGNPNVPVSVKGVVVRLTWL